jgi:hypothetical protein
VTFVLPGTWRGATRGWPGIRGSCYESAPFADVKKPIVRSLDLRTGREKWTAEVKGTISGVFATETRAIVGTSGGIAGFNERGQKMWNQGGFATTRLFGIAR